MAASTTSFLRRLLLPLVLLLAVSANAQIDNVYVYGTVKDYNTSKKLDGITVSVLKDGTKFTSVVTSANGKYEFNLDYGHDYTLTFDKPGMVGKNVTINTIGIPEEDRQGGLAMNVEMTLFQELPGMDFKLLQKPIGKSKYDPETKNLAWDMAYTEQIRSEMERMLKEYDDKKKSEASAEEDFNKAMKQGADAMAAASYDKAVAAFTSALGYKPADPVATAKLSDAQIKLNELTQASKKEAQYAEIIKAADGLFGKKQYAEAKAKYQEATQVKDQEAYPKQKIKECDAFIDELAKKAEEEKKAKELDDKFKAAVAAGDAAFKAEKFDVAKTSFTEAQNLKPAEKYPPEQLAAIARKLDELAKKADADAKAKALDAQYQAAITAADASFKSADYDAAKGKYNEALGLKPKEKYPADQLAAIGQKVKELAEKAEADAKAKALDAQYQAAITAADASYKSAEYDAAKGKYNEALGLKPKEKYPADQLAAIEKKVKELADKAAADAKAKELDAQYQAAISAADASFANAEYDAAKGKYQEALGLKPKEKYPADQLAAITKKTDELARKAEADAKAKALDDKYQQVVADAEKLFSDASYAESRTKYQEALGLKPAEAKPKERIVEIDAKLAELARQAEEKKKQDELDAKYVALVASGDKNFKDKKNPDALNDYKNASALKPEEQYPKDRIAAIEQLMDANAKEKAEQDRLAKEAKDKEDRYNAAIAQADKDFTAKNYDDALGGYEQALDIKPEEKHPADRIQEIRKLRADLAAKNEADSLKAAQEAEEKARLAEEAKRKADEAADLAARYDAAIAKADAAFSSQRFDPAREGYAEALGIKPDEQYPKDRLAAIDAALAERSEADSLANAAAEKARLEAEEQQRQLDAKAKADSLALAQARQERESQQAIDDRYGKVILDADGAMAQQDYSTARGLYAQALDIKAKEVYPQVKIDQIDKLIEEQARLEEERRKAKEAVKPEPAPPPPPAMDNRKEQEAEEFMREAREREEAAKSEKIKRFKQMLQDSTLSYMAAAADRQDANRKRIQGIVDEKASLYVGSEEMRKRNADELAALKQGLEERAKELEARDVADSHEAQKAADEQKLSNSESAADRKQASTAAEEVEREKAERSRHLEELAKAADERTADAYARIEARQQQAADISDKGRSLATKQQEGTELFKEQEALRQQQLANAGKARTMGESDRIGNISPNAERSNADNNPSKLAVEYPQGVTEESYTEGNKVIIRRVVVQGNKANAYSKVIAKWGTFYFKDGQPISEQIWTVNTEQ